jgi:hypothetical protein
MKSKDALIARQELRYRDLDGIWHVVEEGARVPRDHCLVAVHPTMFFVDTDDLVALQTLTNIDAVGNSRTVREGESLSPDDPFVALYPDMIARPIYEPA